MKFLVLFALLACSLLLASPVLAQKSTALDQAKAYAADHDAAVTVRTDSAGYVWVEATGLDPHGVGKTVDEAAEDFLHCADLMDHEPTDPAHKAAQCPDDQGCI